MCELHQKCPISPYAADTEHVSMDKDSQETLAKDRNRMTKGQKPNGERSLMNVFCKGTMFEKWDRLKE